MYVCVCVFTSYGRKKKNPIMLKTGINTFERSPKFEDHIYFLHFFLLLLLEQATCDKKDVFHCFLFLFWFGIALFPPPPSHYLIIIIIIYYVEIGIKNFERENKKKKLFIYVLIISF